MPFRRLAAALSIVLLFVAAAPKKKAAVAPAPHLMAPDSVPHAEAMFLAALCKEGKERITFKAAAYGKHFFLEEPSGVTVYTYNGSGYQRSTFLPKLTLEKAMKKYPDEMK
jgi:hypothetical protein